MKVSIKKLVLVPTFGDFWLTPLAPLHFLMPWTACPGVNSLVPKFCSHPIGSLDVEVSLA